MNHRRVSWLTMWRRAVSAYLVWVLAHVVGGAVFAFGTMLFMPYSWGQIIVDGYMRAPFSAWRNDLLSGHSCLV